MDNRIKEAFNNLINESYQQTKLHRSADQVIMVRTAKNNIYCLVNHILSGNTEEITQFIQMLLDKDDSEIQYVVCMWTDGSQEIPPFEFRKQLLAANPRNAETLLLIAMKPDLYTKYLKDTMPA